MTTTNEVRDFETRLRRDLAELAAIPRARELPLVEGRRRRPVYAMAAAIVVVLVLVAATVAVGGRNDRQPASSGVTPRRQTILEQPAAISGSTTSITKTTFPEVCERWQELPKGVNCSSLQARFVWEPPAAASYKFFVIEVVGRPDPKLTNAAANTGYPIRTAVTVRGRRVPLFGEPSSLSTLWQQRPDLQVWIHVTSERGPDAALAKAVVGFANAMRPVALDAANFAYVLRSGTLPVERRLARGEPGSEWQFTWRPRDRRICTTAIEVGQSGCMPNVKPMSGTTHGLDVTTSDFCPVTWVAKESLVFGVAPVGTRRVVVSRVGESPLVVAVITPPGQHRLRVFIAPFDPSHAVTVAAQDASGATTASTHFPRSTAACTPDRP